MSPEQYEGFKKLLEETIHVGTFREDVLQSWVEGWFTGKGIDHYPASVVAVRVLRGAKWRIATWWGDTRYIVVWSECEVKAEASKT